MEILIFWGIVIMMALSGMKMRLQRAFTFLIGVWFAVYLAVWGLPLMSSYMMFIPPALGGFRNLAALIVSFIAGLLILWKITSAIAQAQDPKSVAPEFEYPPLADTFGGLILNALSGMLLAGMLLLAFTLSPYHDQISFLSGASAAKCARRTIIGFSLPVNRITGTAAQWDARQSDYLDRLLDPIINPLPEEPPPSPKHPRRPVKPAPVPTEKAEISSETTPEATPEATPEQVAAPEAPPMEPGFTPVRKSRTSEKLSKPRQHKLGD